MIVLLCSVSFISTSGVFVTPEIHPIRTHIYYPTMHDALISAILLFFALKTTTNYSLYHCVSQRVILTIIYTGIFLNYKISTAKEDSTSEGRYFKRAHHCCVISKLVLKRGKTEIGYRFPYRVSTTECLTTTFSQNSSSILAVDILLF